MRLYRRHLLSRGVGTFRRGEYGVDTGLVGDGENVVGVFGVFDGFGGYVFVIDGD